MIQLFNPISFISIFLIIFNCSVLQSNNDFDAFEMSVNCLNDHSKCNKDELEYLAISELHDQIDDDKNGDIDITESKDFVEESLSKAQGAEKAKKFHKTDAHIDKQDLWHIWISSEAYNWTTTDLISWLRYEVELPQYESVFNNLKLNGSSLSRLTGMEFLLNVVKIPNSIHRKKIMIKAVDAVLFGSVKRYQLTKTSIVATLFFFISIIAYLLIQNVYSKRFVKTMQSKLKDISKTEESLTELREKLEIVENIKNQKDFEIQQMEERHKYEITRAINSSRESLCDDSRSQHEIARLRSALNEAQTQINHLMKRSASFPGNNELSGDGHQLYLLLQLTRAIELHNLAEKIAAIDRQYAEFMELELFSDLQTVIIVLTDENPNKNQKVNKKKTAFLGSFKLVHSSDMDDIEKGFASTKRAYEKVIYEKKEQELRWNQLENITGFNLTKIADISTLRQLIHTHMESREHQKRECNSTPIFMTSNDTVDSLNSNSIHDSQGTPKSEKSLKFLENSVQFSVDSQNSYDSAENLSSQYRSTEKLNEEMNLNQRSRKEKFDKKKHFLKTGKSRIPSLTRLSTENSK